MRFGCKNVRVMSCFLFFIWQLTWHVPMPSKRLIIKKHSPASIQLSFTAKKDTVIRYALVICVHFNVARYHETSLIWTKKQLKNVKSKCLKFEIDRKLIWRLTQVSWNAEWCFCFRNKEVSKIFLTITITNLWKMHSNCKFMYSTWIEYCIFTGHFKLNVIIFYFP